MHKAPTVAMVAGETSGDLLAGLLLDGLKPRWPELQSFGIGGPQMTKRGFDAWWLSDKLAVRGYVEVLRYYREIVGIREQLKTRLLANPPDIFIGVDAPDFNLDLEAALKANGIKTVHFVSPSIWAWRADRVEKIAWRGIESQTSDYLARWQQRYLARSNPTWRVLLTGRVASG